MDISEINDIAGRFDINETEAKRIAFQVNNESEFVKIWENDDWWTDENIAKRLKSVADRLNAGIEADGGNTFVPTGLCEQGQLHVARELQRHNIDWDVSAVCSEIEDKILSGHNEMRIGSDDTYSYEITNNAASRSGYGIYAHIKITAAMVNFEAAPKSWQT